MASLFKTCLVPKSSIPAIPYANGRHLVNVLVTNFGSSSTRKLSLQRPLHAANYKHLNIRVKNKENQWRVGCNSVGFIFGYPMSDDIICLVKRFIDGIKFENENSLIQFLTDDWELHDHVFNSPSGAKNDEISPTKAKENLKEFLTKARDAIRANIPANIFLKINSITASEHDLTATVQWHLVWVERKKKEGEKEEDKEIEIPFTSSCHVFECVKVDQNLKIRKISRVAQPDQSEPDVSTLKLVEAAVTYFHDFPDKAKAMDECKLKDLVSRIKTYINKPKS